MLYDTVSASDSRVALGPKVDPLRPIYECPLCKAQAMQFYATYGEGDQERTDSFICRACGGSWQN
jgi:DNA-directed RNA polymerase subunit M/transcription elongation factor TFIIS